jgi:hypothetical protein
MNILSIFAHIHGILDFIPAWTLVFRNTFGTRCRHGNEYDHVDGVSTLVRKQRSIDKNNYKLHEKGVPYHFISI